CDRFFGVGIGYGPRNWNIRDLCVAGTGNAKRRRRVGGISIHTTYLTGMITSLISTEGEKYASGVLPVSSRAPDPKIELLCGIWIAFVVGAGTGAAMILHFGAIGMLGAAVILIPLMLREVLS